MSHAARQVILRSNLSLGDIVCMSAAIHELHRACPGHYVTDVRTPFPDVWRHNPEIQPLNDRDPQVESIELHYHRDAYVSVNQSNQHPVHLIEAYCADLAKCLGVNSLRPRELKGHIVLSDAEQEQMSLPHQLYNCQRYWVVCAGGKNDYTTKHWLHDGYQKVVDRFLGRIQFAQVGLIAEGHWHRPLDHVIDLRGKTSVRQLIHTVHAASGVVCGITSLMHLAAAVPIPPWQHRPRPCVVIAGGREPRTWYSYNTHRVLDTVGLLPCCRDGGCWQSHTIPIPGVSTNSQQRLCERVILGSPKCMWMIHPDEVIAQIEKCLESEHIE